jgi:hypothetical protein
MISKQKMKESAFISARRHMIRRPSVIFFFDQEMGKYKAPVQKM